MSAAQYEYNGPDGDGRYHVREVGNGDCIAHTDKEADARRVTAALRDEWPRTVDVDYQTLSAKIAEFCEELNRRELEMRCYQLERAVGLWPALWQALQQKGKLLTFPGKEPVMPDWSEEPVVALKKCYRKPRTRAEAWEIVSRHGDGGWAKISELWLWLVDAGPIMERGMAAYGYLMPREKEGRK